MSGAVNCRTVSRVESKWYRKAPYFEGKHPGRIFVRQNQGNLVPGHYDLCDPETPEWIVDEWWRAIQESGNPLGEPESARQELYEYIMWQRGHVSELGCCSIDVGVSE